MKAISKFILEKMFNNIPNLEKAINCLNDESQDRFIEILVGADIDTSNLYRKIKRNDVIYTIKSANYLKDEIVAEYVSTKVRYFNNQDDADEFSKTGNFLIIESRIIESSIQKTENYLIKGEYKSKHETYFTYDTWMNSEVVK